MATIDEMKAVLAKHGVIDIDASGAYSEMSDGVLSDVLRVAERPRPPRMIWDAALETAAEALRTSDDENYRWHPADAARAILKLKDAK